MPNNKLLTASEAQEALGVGKTTFYNWQKLGLPYSLAGKKKMYDIDEIKEWKAIRDSKLEFDLLKPNNEYSSDEIRSIFHVSPQGGMRSNAADRTMVLLSDHTGSGLYEDYIEDGILYYTGTGKQGDQEFKGPNKTLRDSNKNSYKIFLFESYQDKIYTYRGQAILAGEPFFREAKDENGNMRKVIMFPIKLVDERNLLDEEKLEKRERNSKASADRLNKDQLIDQVLQKDTRVSEVTVSTKRYVRDERVKRFAKVRAKGKCELCGEDAPFSTKDGDPYLEVHHINPLSEGGLDTYDNVAALCPNCHRKMHYAPCEDDKKKALENVNKNNQSFIYNQSFDKI